MARLYIVSTPIGNLGDVTYRATEVFRSVDRILAEDTRRTSILLRHYEIGTPLVSLHAFNEAARAERILAWLDDGEALALVSDAGTPLLSDPGARIVQRVVAGGHDAVPVPGPSAILAALVASGLDPEPFTFVGFPPRRGRARDEWLEEVAALRHVAVVFESPNRLTTTLDELAERCGADRRVVVARELTKVHETFFRGTLREAVDYYEREAARGEIVVVLDGAPADEGEVDAAAAETAEVLAGVLVGRGLRTRAVASELTRRLGVPRNQAYEIALAAARGREGDGS